MRANDKPAVGHTRLSPQLVEQLRAAKRLTAAERLAMIDRLCREATWLATRARRVK